MCSVAVSPIEGGVESGFSADCRHRLREMFGIDFSLFDADSGEIRELAIDQPWLADSAWEPLVRAAAQRECVEVLADEDVLAVLALPLPRIREKQAIAVSTFVTTTCGIKAGQLPCAERWGVKASTLAQWSSRQPAWPLEALLRMAESVRALLLSERETKRLQLDVDDLSLTLTHSFEEISLLYALTRNLRLSRTVTDLGVMALDWLSACIAAESFALLMLPDNLAGAAEQRESEPRLLPHGECPLDESQFLQLLSHVGMSAEETAVVANRNVTGAFDWPFGQVRELIVAPLTEGKHTFGYLAAFNHTSGDEFGSIEASLLGSVATLLGIHAGNHHLYRKQALMVENVVRSFTSAIDAKDAYTCGHSDRVARIAARLAEYLGWDPEQLNTVFMAGVLHDIGKIGIEDEVLRKPGQLTDEEYEHIKQHPVIGHKILEDIQEFAEILPGVLYHHEQWDGRGYPSGLAGEAIPPIARILAVADAFDAMTSDRPYRKGMPDEKVNAIFRAGAGAQWDSRVVEAFFALRGELGRIVCRDEEPSEVECQVPA